MENHQKKTIYDNILEIIAIVALFGASFPLLFYNRIDSNAVFPTHYNIYSEADGWGGRSSLWFSPLIALFFYIGLSIVQKYPRIYNYPCKVTEDNRDYLYRKGVQSMRHVKASVTIILAYVSNSMYVVAIGKCTGPNLLIIFALFAVMLVPVIIYLIKMARYKPKPE